jgi:hypothetical protein
MQRRVFNCATIRMANTDMSGRATADEMNRDLRTRKERSFWHIANLTFLGFLTVAGLLVAIAPMPVHADDDKDRHRGPEDNDKGIHAEIAALQATVSTLQHQVNTLQTVNADLQNELTTLQNQLANAKNVLALDPFVRVDPNPEIGVIGPNIIFSGANIHIVSGSGMTNDNGNARGLGNLIIGYDEAPGPLQSPERGGSHNLVIGRWHRFTKAAFGGFIAGEVNTIDAEAASVTGGFGNTAGGFAASVSGGYISTASGFAASVSGGQSNTASGDFASVSGGFDNTASGGAASLLGGGTNTASASGASVVGGSSNTAGGIETVVIGGQNVTDNKDNSIAPKPPFP